jgi:hypothetical protein
MHVLQYLRDPECAGRKMDSLLAEYRLLCSGTIYRDVIGDWSKSETSRFLLVPPLLLYAASRPIDQYPLELLLRLTVARVEENWPGRSGVPVTASFHPDADVAHDLAALLSVLCRRLITVGGKTSEWRADYQYPPFGHLPLPVITTMRKVYWPPHPASVITWPDGQGVRHEIHDYNPPPLPVDPGEISALLLRLPRVGHAEGIVASARLYALAMELIREQPELAYQILISAVETVANDALNDFQPDDDAKVQRQRPVFDLATQLGLGEEAARRLAVSACQSENWAGKKFKKFVTDNLDDSVWDREDDLFRVPLEVLPRREGLQRTLGEIYGARSRATHRGRRFPASAFYSGGPSVPFHVGQALFGSDSAFPPVVWFERIVNKALRTFWQRSVRELVAAEPAGPVAGAAQPPGDGGR